MDGVAARPPNVTTGEAIFEKNRYALAYKYYMQLFVAIFGYAWIFINAAKVLSSGSTEGYSLTSLSIYLTVTTSYLVWGFLRGDSVLILSSCISIIANLFLLVCLFVVSNT